MFQPYHPLRVLANILSTSVPYTVKRISGWGGNKQATMVVKIMLCESESWETRVVRTIYAGRSGDGGWDKKRKGTSIRKDALTSKVKVSGGHHGMLNFGGLHLRLSQKRY